MHFQINCRIFTDNFKSDLFTSYNMKKILGIDTGTNSLGWAIIGREDDKRWLIAKGVNIFQEGVKLEKGIESSKAAERTSHRALRVRYYRIKLRKIHLLRVLVANHLCPPITSEELRAWKLKKVYPADESFLHWQATDDNTDRNPYAYRHRCLHERLDLSNLADRYVLGRAFYHLAQRRGFLSNRKDNAADETGKVKQAIGQLSEQMQEAGYEYLGDYFHDLYNKGEKIRCHYTARNEHYLAEFKAICERQALDSELVDQLRHAIFNQRPLKSQKGQVGKCVFEKNKARCPASHPRYEEFRMLSFLNNIKVKAPGDIAMRPLTDEERAKVKPVFYRKTKRQFPFEDIAKKLAPRKQYGFCKRSEDSLMPYLFNYPMDTLVSGCPITAALRDLFGEDWEQGVSEVYTLAQGKSRENIVNDVWHALFFYSDSDKLALFAQDRLQLSPDDAKKFCGITLPSDYASLSLKAIRKMLPYLRRRIIYSHAVFLANLGEVVPAYQWDNKVMREVAIGRVTQAMDCDDERDNRTTEQRVKDCLREHYHVSDEVLKRLYHPSMMETFPPVRRDDNGRLRLGSPRISSVRNPMAMRSMFHLRHLINQLLANDWIDPETEVHVEFARELNDANMRKAIEANARNNKKTNDSARRRIAELYKGETGCDIVPTDRDVLKYVLWEEQKHVCLYTGQQINVADFVGDNPRYDIEHTIPRSQGGDSTRMNLTLCDSRFNREVKKTKLPAELACHDDILTRIAPWKDKVEALDSQIRKQKGAAKGATTKQQKDAIIQRRHELELQRNYWRGKYERFVMTSVPEGFSRRQGTDISVISKYARLYLKSLFRQVYTVKGQATSDFRKIWGVQEVYSRKERVNHVHHCIDAIVIACIGLDDYNKLGAYYHDEENHEWYGASKASFPKPWPTFVEDIKRVQDEILVFHHTPDNMRKQGRRRITVAGGHMLSQGDAARGSLHKDTYYGAVEREGDLRYVKRMALADLKESDVEKIVDETVKSIVKQAIKEKGFKAATDPSNTIWMHEEKRIPIRKVRCYQSSVTNPLHIRQHRDVSSKDYKRQFHVANDDNYLLAMYAGKDKKGKERRNFELVNRLQAAEFFRTSNDKEAVGWNLVPEKSKEGYSLVFTLKIGTMVLLYEKSAAEVWEATLNELGRRLYKVTGLSSMTISGNSYATITMRHHEEARQSKDIKAKNGAYRQGEELRPSILMLHTQLHALVQAHDFEINELGEIRWMRDHD